MSKFRMTSGLCLVLLFAVTTSCQDKPTLSHVPLTEEQASVYRAFLEKFSFLHVTNLANATAPFDFKGFPEGKPCLQGLELENVFTAMRTAHTFDSEFVRGTDLKLVNPLDQARLLEEKESHRGSQNGESNKHIQKMDPNLSFHVLSEIVFDTKHDFAVLKHLIFCGQSCVTGETLVVEKVNDKWLVSSRRPCAMFVGN